MYPKVHTLAGANLRWSGVEAHGSPNAMEAHRNLLEPSHEDRTTMGHLRAVTEPVHAWGNLHNSIEVSQESPLRHHKAWEDLHN
jgi:hypothetical protein